MSDERFGAIAERLSGMTMSILGWRPDEFWNATPAELAAALKPTDSEAQIDGPTVERLREQFPDERR